jgi:hypothetical protein
MQQSLGCRRNTLPQPATLYRFFLVYLGVLRRPGFSAGADRLMVCLECAAAALGVDDHQG